MSTVGVSTDLARRCRGAERAVRQAGGRTMWAARSSRPAGPGSTRVVLERGGAVASYREVLDAWQSDASFCGWFDDLLAAASFEAFRWETPPVTLESLGRPFEFVLLDSPDLARAPERSVFAEHFRAQAERDVLTFANLGGDAIMVVPRPLGADEAYAHLAAFVRRAPEGQRRLLWERVAQAMADRVSARPVWLSTAGAGVSWLHVRLDDRPKYYGFAPYREPLERA